MAKPVKLTLDTFDTSGCWKLLLLVHAEHAAYPIVFLLPGKETEGHDVAWKQTEFLPFYADVREIPALRGLDFFLSHA